MLLVIELYHLLHDEYHRVFGIMPEYLVGNEGNHIPNRDSPPKNPGILLPSHAEWCFSPEWHCPFPIGADRSRLMPNLSPRHEHMMLCIETAEMVEVEHSIFSRVKTHRQIHHAEAILTASIEQAKIDLHKAQEEYSTK
jgi:hypothetical protein